MISGLEIVTFFTFMCIKTLEGAAKVLVHEKEFYHCFWTNAAVFEYHVLISSNHGNNSKECHCLFPKKRDQLIKETKLQRLPSFYTIYALDNAPHLT